MSNVNYGGMSGSFNCTVPHADQIRAKEEIRKKLEEQVAKNQEYQRVPKGKRTLSHDIEEEVYEDGGAKTVTTKITTKRTNR